MTSLAILENKIVTNDHNIEVRLPLNVEILRERTGNDEFQGLRNYTAGDSLRRVDWKGYARGRGLNTKQFEEPVGGRLWLRWDRLQGLGEEQRLSILCYWILQLDPQRQPYGLELPGLTLAPDTGDVHRWRLLDALASYPDF